MTLSEAAALVVDALEQQGIAYMVTGGLAANLYGIPRATHDADIVLQVSGSDMAKVAMAFPTELELDPQITFETITGSSRQTLRTLDDEDPVEIELFFLGRDDHHQERFQRRRRRAIVEIGREGWVATAEDMIIQKLRWNRDKDRDDALNILAVQGDALDFTYIEKWCAVHGTLQRLAEMRRSIPPDLAGAG
jgi:hypothetical protein